MQTLKYLFLLASAALLFSSCEDFFSQTIEIDPPEYDKNLSFHLDLSNRDSVIRLLVTRNYGILEDPDLYRNWFVEGASAEIYENGQSWLTLSPHSQDSSYILEGVLPHAFKAGSTYEIRLQHPDFPTLTAVQTVPPDVAVDSVRVRYDAVLGEDGDVLDLLEIFIKDPPGEKNIYQVDMVNQVFDIQYNVNTGMADTVGIIQYSLYVDGYNDPNVQSGFDNAGFIQDQFFDGQAYRFQAKFEAGSSDLIDSLITVRVRNVNDDLYKWSLSYQKKYDSEDNPLVEPIAVYNNLVNGLGIFSIANEKRYLIKRQ